MAAARRPRRGGRARRAVGPSPLRGRTGHGARAAPATSTWTLVVTSSRGRHAGVPSAIDSTRSNELWTGRDRPGVVWIREDRGVSASDADWVLAVDVRVASAGGERRTATAGGGGVRPGDDGSSAVRPPLAV